jgi:transcription antitermination factor NusG
MVNTASAEPAGNSSLPRWHALYTRHQHEKVVSQALTDKGFQVFLPQYRTLHQWKDRRKELVLPLFPNYVFIQGGLERMLNIVSTPGVQALVSWGGRAAEISGEEIETIRRVVEGPWGVQPHRFLQCGERVRVKAGPLQGIEGILVRRGGGFRLVLTVEMLSQSAAVEVEAVLVERVQRN